MDSSTVVLGLRVALALACVFGLMWWAGRRMAGTPAGRRARATSLDVVARQSVGQKASVALVEIEGRRLLLGVSEHGVTLLTEIEAAPAEPQDAADRVALDPSELAELADLDGIGELADLELTQTTGASRPSGSTNVRPRTMSPRPTPPAARKPAVPTSRNPLEGSVLSAATWRQAVVAVQERTIRR